MAELFGELLARRGHQILVVHSGRAALDQIANFQPDVVLLDLGLPIMDGYQVARQIRDLYTGNLIIVAITGYQNDELRLKQAGFHHHFTKPVDLEKLTALLETPDATLDVQPS